MRFQLIVNDEAHEVTTDGGVAVDGHSIAGNALVEGRTIVVRLGKKRHRVLLTRWGCVVDDAPYRVEIHDLEPGLASESSAGPRSSALGRVEVHPPMPGRIVRVSVKVGDRVARYAPLAVLEAMKMQNEIPAPVAGVVKEIRVNQGQTVLVSDVVIVLTPG